jgi:hypothetical protein
MPLNIRSINGVSIANDGTATIGGGATYAQAAAASAAEAALYDGPKVDTFEELDALTSAEIDVGDLVRVIETGAVYERVSSGADFTTAGGIGLRVLDAIRPEMFATIEAAITAAAQTGRAIRGTPGRTYTFTAGVTVSRLIADFTGCKLMRSASMANRSALRVESPLSATSYAAADDVLGFSLVEFDFGNSATFVPRITVADASLYSVGGIVKVLSSDKIPASAMFADGRFAEMGEIGAIDTGDNYLYLIRPFAETWTAEKIVRLTATDCQLVGGEWFDEPGYPVERNAPIVEMIGLVRPEYRNMHFRDTAAVQLAIATCYEPISRDNRFDRARNLPAQGAFSYGEKHLATVRPFQDGAVGTGMRHIFDTGGNTTSDASLNSADPKFIGGVVSALVQNGVGYDCINAPFNDHDDAYGTVIENCKSLYTNRRSPIATLWGLLIRGRAAKIIGGYYEGLNPARFQLSTNDVAHVLGAVFSKPASTDLDAAKQPLIEINGDNVASGKARVKMQKVALSQKRGRKEMMLLENAEVDFSGSIEYAATQTNFVFARLDDASTLNIHALDADFSEATAATPMLTSLADADSSVFAPGRVVVKDSPVSSSIVLTDFNNEAGEADWRDVTGDGPLFASGLGWRNAGSAGLQRAVYKRSDTSSQSNDITVNFSSSAGAKTITWPAGMAWPEIFVAVNATIAGTELGTIPNGAFTGQRAVLSNVGTQTFEVNSTPANVTVAAARTVAAGASLVLRWSGSAWTA